MEPSRLTRHGLGEVCRLASALKLFESVRDQKSQLFRCVQNENLLRGKSIEVIAAASVYGTCRCNGLSRFLEEIVAVSQVEESRVTNIFKTLNKELGLPARPVTPSAFVPRLASELECPAGIRQRARTLAKQAVDAGSRPAVSRQYLRRRIFSAELPLADERSWPELLESTPESRRSGGRRPRGVRGRTQKSARRWTPR